MKRGNPSVNDFFKSMGPLEKMDFNSFRRQNANINTMGNLNLNKNCTLESYYNSYLWKPPVFLSVVHIFLTISAYYHKWSELVSPSRFHTISALLLQEIVRYAFWHNGSDNDYVYVGNLAGMLWIGTSMWNLFVFTLVVLQWLLLAARDWIVYTYCLQTKHPTTSNQATQTIIDPESREPIIDTDRDHFSFEMEEDDMYNYGSQKRRKKAWTLNYLFLDIFTTIRMFRLTCCHGAPSSLIMLDDVSVPPEWSRLIEAKKRPLTIITPVDPLFVVSDFDSMRGLEKNQHEFARIFLYFADPDQAWFKFYSLKDNCIHRFLLKKRNILLSEIKGNGVYDTVLRFTDCNPNESRKRKLIYSTVSFDVDLFCKGAPEKYTFMTAIMDVLGNKDVNLFLKRIICNMAAAKWHNVYHGAMMTKYLLTEFSEVAFWVVPQNKPPFYYNRGALDLKKTAGRKRVVKLCEETKQCTVHNFGDKDVSGKHNEENVHLANFLVN